jgi:branched-chain amino acid transport system permease protein
MSVVIIGLSIGFLLFILAAGLTLIFGMLGVINFAHGSLYMLGAYIAYSVVQFIGSFWLALLVAPAVVLVLGAFAERVALRPLYTRDHHYQLLMTFGFILILEEAVKMIWGLSYKEVNPPAPFDSPVNAWGMTVSSYRLFVIGFGAAVSVLLFYVLEKTKVGVTIRAASSDAETVQALGINVGLVRSGVFAFGAALAALGGVIAAPIFPVELGMGFNIIIDCFIVIIIGGLGSIKGAIVAALMLGMVRAMGYAVAPDWVDFIGYSLLIIVLLTRPEGLFGRARRTA